MCFLRHWQSQCMFYKICCLKNILKDFLNIIFLCAAMAMTLLFVVESRLLDYQTANVGNLSEWQDAYCLRLLRRFLRSWFSAIDERMFTVGDIERLLTTDRCNAQKEHPTSVGGLKNVHADCFSPNARKMQSALDIEHYH